jgi:hypothetical protein
VNAKHERMDYMHYSRDFKMRIDSTDENSHKDIQLIGTGGKQVGTTVASSQN